MKKLSRLGWVLGLAALLWSGCQPPPPGSAGKAAEAAAWLATRTWTAGDGRTLEGALVARMGEEGVIRRAVDGALLRMPPRFLDPANVEFMRSAFDSGAVPTTLPDVWFLRTKMTIPGGEAYVSSVDTRNAVGPRIAKVEASYWLLLSELDGSNAKWARVDNHAYSSVRPDSFVRHSELANQRNGSGAFLDEVPCPRKEVYVIDARYGLPSRRINVTRAVMGFLAEGRLPLTINPELFGLEPHHPDVWDLTITWQRVGEGALTRVVRDDSILAWPEASR